MTIEIDSERYSEIDAAARDELLRREADILRWLFAVQGTEVVAPADERIREPGLGEGHSGESLRFEDARSADDRLERLVRELEAERRKNQALTTALAFTETALALTKENLVTTEAALAFTETALALTKENLVTTEAALVAAEEALVKDELTAAFNRRYFNREIERVHAASVREKCGYALIMIDSDKFKWVNDTFGHPAGDAVLQQLVAIMSSQLRTEDAFMRIGGDEFVVILQKSPSLDDAAVIAERLRAAVAGRKFYLPNGEEIDFTISLGVAHNSDALNQTAEQTVKRADRALYAAKGEITPEDPLPGALTVKPKNRVVSLDGNGRFRIQTQAEGSQEHLIASLDWILSKLDDEAPLVMLADIEHLKEGDRTIVGHQLKGWGIEAMTALDENDHTCVIVQHNDFDNLWIARQKWVVTVEPNNRVIISADISDLDGDRRAALVASLINCGIGWVEATNGDDQGRVEIPLADFRDMRSKLHAVAVVNPQAPGSTPAPPLSPPPAP